QAVADALLARKNRIPALLDAIEQGQVPPSSLTAMHRIRLREHPDPTIRRRARKLLAGRAGTKQRQEVLVRYRAALAEPRDPQHGKQVFEEQCSKCHKLQGEGFEVGPDLSSVVNRADETLVGDVLEPSQTITVGFQSYTVVTRDGRVFNGVLAAETATSITLRKEQGVDQVILRRDIDIMVASPVSMMPEEMEKQISPKDLADLIAYLRQVLGPPLPAAVTLVDEDPKIVRLLDSGSGSVRMIGGDTFSGRRALAVTPPQRYSQRLPGWAFRITEKPGPGEFRYIRFAWKSPAGAGVMIELAADGAWPPADKPLRRYYSGKNLTSWAAVQISPDPPRDWVVVTRDLYQDFGSFTLTGIAPTAMGGEALFDRIELLRTLDAAVSDRDTKSETETADAQAPR
ncbi:MAG: c-type cytochrome, partial [Planctomycetes bacterium]|nr:c-type cytochrome [Planctomycetota bacterium]